MYTKSKANQIPKSTAVKRVKKKQLFWYTAEWRAQWLLFLCQNPVKIHMGRGFHYIIFQ